MAKMVCNVCPYCGQVISYRAFKDESVAWFERKSTSGNGIRRVYFHKTCFDAHNGRRKEVNGKA